MGEEFWKGEYARDLLKALGYDGDIDAMDDDTAIECAELEGFEWSDEDSHWNPLEGIEDA